MDTICVKSRLLWWLIAVKSPDIIENNDLLWLQQRRAQGRWRLRLPGAQFCLSLSLWQQSSSYQATGQLLDSPGWMTWPSTVPPARDVSCRRTSARPGRKTCLINLLEKKTWEKMQSSTKYRGLAGRGSAERRVSQLRTRNKVWHQERQKKRGEWKPDKKWRMERDHRESFQFG